MGLGTTIAEGLGLAGKYLGRLAPTAERAAAAAAPAVEQAAVKAVTKPSTTRMIFESALPNAALTTGYNLLSGASLPASLAAGAVDLGTNVGLTKLAGKFAPGAIDTINRTDAKGNIKTIQQYSPSVPQAVAQTLSPFISSAIVSPFTQAQSRQPVNQPADNIESTSAYYQDLQRRYLNNLEAEAVSPGTNFQLQGLPQTPSFTYQAPAGLDPYGLSRGAF
jgi:hypothetical protein